MPPTSTFNSHPVAFTFSPSDGLTISPGPADPSSNLPAASLICLRPTDFPHTYTLLHQIANKELVQTPITRPPSGLLAYLLLSALPAHLSSSCDLTVLVSTSSGGSSATTYYTTILEPLLQALSLSPTVVLTTTATSIPETLSALSQTRPQTLLLLSGDTGIHEALNASLPPSLALAIFPLGTGNALSSSYHGPSGALRALLFGTPKPLPLFTAAFPHGTRWLDTGLPATTVLGAVVVSWGFHASLVADAEALRGKDVGVERFKVAAAGNLSAPLHAYRGEVSYAALGGGWTVVPRSEHFYVLVTLCSNLESAFRISPESVRGEEVLWMVHFAVPEGIRGAEEVMRIMGAAYAGGKHVEDESVGYEKARAVAVEIGEGEERWRRVCVDGRIVVLPEGGRVEVKVVKREGIRLVWADDE